MPHEETNEALEIKFDEPLDYFLLQESIQIVDKNNKSLEGEIHVSNKERKFQFVRESNG